jgi:hypothetical protein
MTCAIANGDRLERLLRNEVQPQERAALLAHLDEPCEECLDVLAAQGADEFLTTLAAGDAMRPDEADRVFAAATTPERRTSVWRRRSTWARLSAAAAAAAAMLVAVQEGKRVGWPARRDEAPGAASAPSTAAATGRNAPLAEVAPAEPTIASKKPVLHKAGPAPAPDAELIAFAAEPGPEPRLRGRVADGDTVTRGDRLLFRVRLSAPALVYLVGEGNAAPSTLLWPRSGDPRRPAGEFELDVGHEAMAVDVGQLGTSVSIALFACSETDYHLTTQRSPTAEDRACTVRRLRVQVRDSR